jgi:hypothetical protein
VSETGVVQGTFNFLLDSLYLVIGATFLPRPESRDNQTQP